MRKTLEIIKWMLVLPAILLFLSFSLSISSYKHLHILPDGSVVEHSHPFSDHGGKQHQHSHQEIQFLSQISSYLDLAQTTVQVIVKTQLLFISATIEIQENIQLSELPLNIFRGPPAC